MEDILRLNFLLQSVIHKIEDLDNSVYYKHELKRLSNRYYKYIESIIEKTTFSMNTEEHIEYSKVVNEIDLLINNVEIETDNRR